MYKYLLIALLLVLGFSSSATQAGEADCDSKCQAYKHAASTGPVPYNGPTICVAFKQAKVDNVVIRFYDATGKELDPKDQLHSRKNAAVEDKICPAAHWFEEAARAELCNSYEGRWLEPEHLAILLQLKGMPEGKFVHLDKPR